MGGVAVRLIAVLLSLVAPTLSAPAQELSALARFDARASSLRDAGAGIEVRQGSHARAREESGERGHMPTSAASTER